MFILPRNVSNKQLLVSVRHWLDALAREDYDAVFDALGYLVAGHASGSDSIRQAIKRYRSPELYPGVEEFVVTDWRLASGGNPTPLQLLRRYEPNSLGIKATVEIDLPLNGRWSDLEADFVLFESTKESDDELVLTLEDIDSSAQRQRELACADAKATDKTSD